MLVKTIREQFHKELDEMYGKEEVSHFFFLLLEQYCQISRIELALDINKEISSNDALQFSNALEELKLQRPIQYIIGETEFYGLKFKVNSNVLIPRPETEELVNWIVKDVNDNNLNSLKILDIGTGSGCIAIALAKVLPNAKVFALDVSEEAIKVARENSKLNAVEIEFLQNDILNSSDFKIDNKPISFDIIVSNPPYVRYKEKEQMKPNVLGYEPHLALFVKNEDPLLFYSAITKFAVNNLKQNGKLFFEINEYLGKQMNDLFKDFPFNNIELKTDVFKKDRMLKAIKN